MTNDEPRFSDRHVRLLPEVPLNLDIGSNDHHNDEILYIVEAPVVLLADERPQARRRPWADFLTRTPAGGRGCTTGLPQAPARLWQSSPVTISLLRAEAVGEGAPLLPPAFRPRDDASMRTYELGIPALPVEWVSKAEADYALMEREGRVRKNPAYDGVCFHAQPCAEMYIKARLCEAGVEFGKTHDLVTLLDAATPLEPSWGTLRRDLAYLSVFVVAYCYPGDSATREQAKDAIRRCCLFRKAARQALPIGESL